MKIRTAGTATASVLLLAGMSAAFAPAPAGADAVDCAYTVSLPKAVTVKQAVVGLTATLAATSTTGADCTAEFDVATHLVHGTDDEMFDWGESNPTTDTETLYAIEVVPGTYTTAAGTCYATSADFTDTYTCTVADTSTVIKFSSATRLTLKRTKKAPRDVAFTVRSTRFSEFGAANQAARVSIQRYSAGEWHTIHTAKTDAKTGAYTWIHKYPTKAKYRAVSATTAAAWASTSRTTTQ